jgi:hypothetical protein
MGPSKANLTYLGGRDKNVTGQMDDGRINPGEFRPPGEPDHIRPVHRLKYLPRQVSVEEGIYGVSAQGDPYALSHGRFNPWK